MPDLIDREWITDTIEVLAGANLSVPVGLGRRDCFVLRAMRARHVSPVILRAMRAGHVSLVIDGMDYGGIPVSWLDQWFLLEPNSLLLRPEQSIELRNDSAAPLFLVLKGDFPRPISTRAHAKL